MFAAAPHAGFEFGQQVRDVVGVVQPGRRFDGGEGLPAGQFGLDQDLQLLLVGVGVLLGVEIPGHRLHHLPGHLQFRSANLDILTK